MSTPIPIGVIISGRGSNMQAIVAAQHAGKLSAGQVAVVLSNRPQAEGLAWAADNEIPTAVVNPKDYGSRQEADAAMVAVLQEYGVQWVVLAGYDRIITEPLLTAFDGRLLNIHPSLLPAYGGKGMVGIKVHQAVIAGQETQSGCTVHGVTAEVDAGPILGQATVPVLPGDTPEDLAERVLAQEHQLYYRVIQSVLSGGPTPVRLSTLPEGCSVHG